MIIIGEPFNTKDYIEVTDQEKIKELHKKGVLPRYRLGKKVWFYKYGIIEKGGVEVGTDN